MTVSRLLRHAREEIQGIKVRPRYSAKSPPSILTAVSVGFLAENLGRTLQWIRSFQINMGSNRENTKINKIPTNLQGIRDTFESSGLMGDLSLIYIEDTTQQ